MARLRHPNCCQYLGLCLDPPSLLMEYCSQRSVDTILASGRTDARVGGPWRERGVVPFEGSRGSSARSAIHQHPCPALFQIAKALSWPRLLSMAFDAAKVRGRAEGGEGRCDGSRVRFGGHRNEWLQKGLVWHGGRACVRAPCWRQGLAR